jgi:hypothetical protein
MREAIFHYPKRLHGVVLSEAQDKSSDYEWLIYDANYPSHNLPVLTCRKQNWKTLWVYGCETWSLTLGEEQRSKVSEHRAQGAEENIWT